MSKDLYIDDIGREVKIPDVPNDINPNITPKDSEKITNSPITDIYNKSNNEINAYERVMIEIGPYINFINIFYNKLFLNIDEYNYEITEMINDILNVQSEYNIQIISPNDNNENNIIEIKYNYYEILIMKLMNDLNNFYKIFFIKNNEINCINKILNYIDKINEYITNLYSPYNFDNKEEKNLYHYDKFFKFNIIKKIKNKNQIDKFNIIEDIKDPRNQGIVILDPDPNMVLITKLITGKEIELKEFNEVLENVNNYCEKIYAIIEPYKRNPIEKKNFKIGKNDIIYDESTFYVNTYITNIEIVKFIIMYILIDLNSLSVFNNMFLYLKDQITKILGGGYEFVENGEKLNKYAKENLKNMIFDLIELEKGKTYRKNFKNYLKSNNQYIDDELKGDYYEYYQLLTDIDNFGEDFNIKDLKDFVNKIKCRFLFYVIEQIDYFYNKDLQERPTETSLRIN